MNSQNWKSFRNLGVVLLVISLIPKVSNAEGMETNFQVRMIWEKEFDSIIVQREYFHNIIEPDAGVSLDKDRVNPISMVATYKSVYVLNAQGNVERKIPLKRENVPEVEKGDKRVFVNEYGTTAPDGQFFIIYTIESRAWEKRLTGVRGFNPDESVRFELGQNDLEGPEKVSGDGYEKIHIAPNGNYLVVFYNAFAFSPLPYINFFDNEGVLIKRFGINQFNEYSFDPWSIGFTEDGNMVIIDAFKMGDLMILNQHGEFLQKRTGEGEARETQQFRDAIKRILKPDAVEARRKSGGRHLSGIAEFRLLKNGSQGIFSEDNRMYLFQMLNTDSGGTDEKD